MSALHGARRQLQWLFLRLTWWKHEVSFIRLLLDRTGLWASESRLRLQLPHNRIPVDQENVRKAKALLDQMIEALGGNAYLNIEDVSQEGRSYGFHLGESEGVGTLFWRFYKFPDKDRVELTKKRDVVYVYRGDKGFEITYKGTRSDDPKAVSDYVRRREYSLDWVIRKWLPQPGIALFYEGHTVAAQKDAEQVTIMNCERSERHLVHRYRARICR